MVENNVASYWDNQAKRKLGLENVLDNIWKRQILVKKLLEYNFYNKSILEIGVGPGTTFAAIGTILLNRFEYIGTDTSKEYVDFVKRHWKMNATQTDVMNLPGGDKSYDYVIALDVLAHVEPHQRIEGYNEISRVLKDDGTVILNVTKVGTEIDSEAYHWGFFYRDLLELVDICSLKIEKIERYAVEIPATKEVRVYEFFVGRRYEPS